MTKGDEKFRLPADVLDKAAARIRYMGHPQRLRILEFLDIQGPSSVSEIMKAAGLEQIATSQSLRKLKQDGLVKSERKGRFVIYQLTNTQILDCMRRNYAKSRGLPVPAEGEKVTRRLPNVFLDAVAERMHLIAHPLRVRILEFLDNAGESSVSDIMKDIGIEQITASQSLKKMKEDGIVACRRDGRFVLYRIAADLPRTLLDCMRKHYKESEGKSRD